MSKYNIRDNKGKFVKVSFVKACACKGACNGSKIVAGRLYDWKGVTVRAFGKVGEKRVVAIHKTLTGLVNDRELSTVSKQAVESYLAKV